jgi:hypothetical protein
MRIEHTLRIVDPETKAVIYENGYAHEERATTDMRVLLAEYAALAPNRIKRQLEAGIAQFALWHAERQQELAKSAKRDPAPTKLPPPKKPGKKGSAS